MNTSPNLKQPIMKKAAIYLLSILSILHSSHASFTFDLISGSYELTISQDIVIECTAQQVKPCPKASVELWVPGMFLIANFPLASVPDANFTNLKLEVVAKNDSDEYVTYEYQAADFRAAEGAPQIPSGFYQGQFRFDTPDITLPDTFTHSIERFVIRAGTYSTGPGFIAPDVTSFAATDFSYSYDNIECLADPGVTPRETYVLGSSAVSTAVEPSTAANLGILVSFDTEETLQYIIESSPDLSAWTTAAGPFIGDGTTQTVSFPTDQNRLFYRVIEGF
ncbi:MAG: hypothetical protein AAFY98_08770 [Verrucomicrobiota bacterium]